MGTVIKNRIRSPQGNCSCPPSLLLPFAPLAPHGPLPPQGAANATIAAQIWFHSHCPWPLKYHFTLALACYVALVTAADSFLSPRCRLFNPPWPCSLTRPCSSALVLFARLAPCSRLFFSAVVMIHDPSFWTSFCFQFDSWAQGIPILQYLTFNRNADLELVPVKRCRDYSIRCFPCRPDTSASSAGCANAFPRSICS